MYNFCKELSVKTDPFLQIVLMPLRIWKKNRKKKIYIYIKRNSPTNSRLYIVYSIYSGKIEGDGTVSFLFTF